MSENLSENNLDNMMLGDVSEGASEKASEEIAARAAAAAKRMKQLRKDEGAAKGFDEKLAKILQTFDLELLMFVAFLIDNNIPSLTILSLVAIAHDQSAKICAKCFAKRVTKASNHAELELVGFANPEIATKIDLWWEFIFLADQESTTTSLRSFQANKPFIEKISAGLAQILREFLTKNDVTEFNKDELERVLNSRGKKVFQAE